jgi:uncharacterized protein (UPF0335 family)
MPDQQPTKAERSIEELIAESERLQESSRQIAKQMDEVFRCIKERTEKLQHEHLR